MENDERFRIIWAQIQALLIYLDRPVVRQQLLAFALIFLLAWLLSTGFWRLFRGKLAGWGEQRLGNKGQRYWNLGLRLAEQISFPVLGKLGIEISVFLFLRQGWLPNLLIAASPLFDFILVYRIVITLLYFSFGPAFRPYHYRLLAPTFGLFILAWLTSFGVFNLRAWGSITVFESVNGPVTIGSLVGGLLVVYFLFMIAWAVQDILERVVVPRSEINPGAFNAVLTIGRYAVIVVGVLIVFGTLGINVATITAFAAALGVGIGLGLQRIVSNFISGIALLFDQSVRPGDVVLVENTLGEVQSLNVRATTVRTFDNVDIVMPNEVLFTTPVTNYTQSSRIVRIIMAIGVGYDSDPSEVMDILLEAANEHRLVLNDPEPLAFFHEYGESSLIFNLAIWVDDPVDQLRRVPSDLRLMIWKRFKDRGIEIPFPQRDLHLRSGTLVATPEPAAADSSSAA